VGSELLYVTQGRGYELSQLDGEMKILPGNLDEANRMLRGKSKDTTLALLKEKTVEIIRPTPKTEEDLAIEKLIDEDVAEGMELIYAEAQETLALNPNDEEAQTRVLAYKAWKKRPNGLVIQKKPSAGNFGVWKRTRDYGWLVKVGVRSNLVVGEMVNIRKKGGDIVRMQLTEEVASGYWKVREC
jgi:hypothetical protein